MEDLVKRGDEGGGEGESEGGAGVIIDLGEDVVDSRLREKGRRRD